MKVAEVVVDDTTNEPVIEELVAKALREGVIDSEFAADLRGCADLEEALGMFYTYIIEEGGDPEELLRQWGIITDSSE